jgi:tetratricopeptide (TPR) repeat protein/RNA polymerase subunit RPABC4/transcription elongation factor Spt4
MALIQCPDCEREVSSRAHACPQCAYPIERLTNLFDAVIQHDAEMIADLVRAGFDVNNTNSDGLTPLMLACQKGEYEIANQLVAFGAKVNQTREGGRTALMDAAEYGSERIISLLMNSGADPTIKNQDGGTAFDLAVRKKKASVVAKLRGLLPEPVAVSEPDLPEELEKTVEMTSSCDEISNEVVEDIPPLPVAPEPYVEKIEAERHLPPPLPPNEISVTPVYIEEVTEPEKEELYAGPGLICRSCKGEISIQDIWCPHCKGPIIKRYCGSCGDLIPDNVARCPLCKSSKVGRFRYIRNMEQIVAGGVVFAILVFLFSIYAPERKPIQPAQTQIAQKTQSLPEQKPTEHHQYTSAQARVYAAKGSNNQRDRLVATKATLQDEANGIETIRKLEVPSTGDAEAAESHSVVQQQEQQFTSPENQNQDADQQPQQPKEEKKTEPAENSQRQEQADPQPQQNSDQSSGGENIEGERLNNIGYRLMKSGRYTEAIPVLAQALRSFPKEKRSVTYGYALYNLGRSLRLAGRPDLAIPILEERLKIPDQRYVVARELELARDEAGISNGSRGENPSFQ